MAAGSSTDLFLHHTQWQWKECGELYLHFPNTTSWLKYRGNLCSSQILHFIKIHSSRTNLLQVVTNEQIHTLASQQQRNITAGQTGNCCELSGYSPGSWTGSHSLGNTPGTRIPHREHGLPQLWCMNVRPWSAPSVTSWNCHRDTN